MHWRRARLPTPVFLGFPCGSAGKESASNARDLGLIPGLRRPLEKGKATHSSILAWRIHGLYSPWGHKQSDKTEQLSLTHWNRKHRWKSNLQVTKKDYMCWRQPRDRDCFFYYLFLTGVELFYFFIFHILKIFISLNYFSTVERDKICFFFVF